MVNFLIIKFSLDQTNFIELVDIITDEFKCEPSIFVRDEKIAIKVQIQSS